MQLADLQWLCSPEALELRSQILKFCPPKRKWDPLAAHKYLKHLVPERRRALSEWIGLTAKVQTKFDTEEPLLLDTFAYEQSTAADLGRWKAQWIKELGFESVWDLCSGMGADSMWLDAQIAVEAVDLDPCRLEMSRHNHALLRGGEWRGHLKDVALALPASEQRTLGRVCWLGDPDRRGGERHGQWDLERLRPGLDVWKAWAQAVPDAMLKLPPAADEQKALDVFEGEAAALWAGDRQSCRELLVCGGAFARNLSAATVHVDQIMDFQTWRFVLDAPSNQIFGGVRYAAGPDPRALGAWIAEPAPGILRAGLVGELAARFGAWTLEHRGAYVSFDEPVDTVFWNAWRVLDVVPLEIKALTRRLRELGLGSVALKRRPGLDLDTDAWGKKLSATQGEPAVVFAVRLTASPFPMRWMGVIAVR
jgi:hypothetical protein